MKCTSQVNNIQIKSYANPRRFRIGVEVFTHDKIATRTRKQVSHKQAQSGACGNIGNVIVRQRLQFTCDRQTDRHVLRCPQTSPGTADLPYR